MFWKKKKNLLQITREQLQGVMNHAELLADHIGKLAVAQKNDSLERQKILEKINALEKAIKIIPSLSDQLSEQNETESKIAISSINKKLASFEKRAKIRDKKYEDLERYCSALKDRVGKAETALEKSASLLKNDALKATDIYREIGAKISDLQSRYLGLVRFQQALSKQMNQLSIQTQNSNSAELPTGTITG